MTRLAPAPLLLALTALVAVACTWAGCEAEAPGLSRSPRPAGSVGVREPGTTGLPDAAVRDAGDAALPPGTPTVEILSPAEGAVLVRSDRVGGEWAARALLRVSATGVGQLSIGFDGAELARLSDPPWETELVLTADGDHRLVAAGLGASGEALGVEDAVSITVAPPADTGCQAELAGLGVDFTPLDSLRGVADPIRVQPVIGGVRFRYVTHTTAMPMSMDCTLALALVRLAALVQEYGIEEVVHIGVYNYRCIGGGDPDVDGCTPSQHATATAIDIRGFSLPGSELDYDVLNDWVITSRADPCPISSSSEPDRVLKELACRMWSDRIFNIILTPNYNAVHRNHFHVDLTEGSHYLGRTLAGLDPPIAGLGD